MTARAPRRGTNLKMIGALLAAGVVGSLAFVGVATATWTASGSATAVSTLAAVMPTGATPSVGTGYTSTVTVTWPATTLSTGAAVAGYTVNSFDASTNASRSVGAGCSGTVSALTCTETGVPDGRWYYTVTPTLGTKWVGTASSASPTATVDTSAPGTATLATLPTTIRNGQVLTGSGTDATSGVASITYLSCTGSGSCTPTTVIGTGTVSPSYPFTWSAQPADATFRIMARVTDAAAHTKDSAIQTVTIDNAAPAVTLTAPANASLTTDNTPTLSGAAGNTTGDATTVTVRIYAGTGTGGTVVQTLTPTRSAATWTTTASTLADGTYTAQATQSDAAGNTGTSSANTFTVDTTSPTPSAVASTNGDGNVDFGDTFSVTFSEALAPASVPGTGSLTLTNGSGNDTFTLSGLTNGALSTGTTGWVKNGKTISYGVTYALSAGNTQVTATIGSCTSGCANAGSFASNAQLTFVPASTLKDPAGHTATGGKTVTLRLF